MNSLSLDDKDYAKDKADSEGADNDNKSRKKVTKEFAERRIDEVRDLVDCGGSDLGFCDMSSKYPG